jgi:hypothetical protein
MQEQQEPVVETPPAVNDDGADVWMENAKILCELAKEHKCLDNYISQKGDVMILAQSAFPFVSLPCQGTLDPLADLIKGDAAKRLLRSLPKTDDLMCAFKPLGWGENMSPGLQVSVKSLRLEPENHDPTRQNTEDCPHSRISSGA